MRLILALLALANLRWATADIERSQRLSREADASLASADLRMVTARAFAERAQFHR